jgi:hypothetical protein
VKECSWIVTKVQEDFQKFASEQGTSNFLVDLTEGLGPVLVLVIIKLSLKPGQILRAVFLPGLETPTDRIKKIEDLVKNLKIDLTYFPLKFLETTARKAGFEGGVHHHLRVAYVEGLAERDESLILNPLIGELSCEELNTLALYLNQISSLIPKDLLGEAKVEYKESRQCPIVNLRETT